jgi:hypothetical protein
VLETVPKLCDEGETFRGRQANNLVGSKQFHVSSLREKGSGGQECTPVGNYRVTVDMTATMIIPAKRVSTLFRQIISPDLFISCQVGASPSKNLALTRYPDLKCEE